MKWLAGVLVGMGLAWGQSGEEFQLHFDEHYLPQVAQLLDNGEARAAEVVAGEAMNRGGDVAAWRMMYVRALWLQGRLSKASEKLPGWVEEHASDVRFLELAAEAFEELGEPAAAGAAREKLNVAAQQKALARRTADELVAMGRSACAMGAAPEQVLQRYYGRARALEPGNASSYLAAGELALSKHDYDRAAREFRAGLDQKPDHAGLRFGLARSFWPGDREQALEEADKALRANPRHVGALLMRAEHLVDQEEYDQATLPLGLVDKVFPGHPLGKAFSAVIAWLRDHDEAARDAAFEEALAYRPRNAEVPHLVGRCLSRKHRLAEGERYQRMALEWAPGHPGARLALARDLLEQGREEEGWAMAEQAAAADPYNALARNYGVLKRQMMGYATRESGHFVVRMRPDEMAIYGDRVMTLLEQARRVLTAKYEVDLKRKTLVEIFAEQQDFAIRTFGEPGGAGYLGVCFGTVITMNSPAGAGVTGLNNWETTLWHEFAHVVTLAATANCMPRWLSEGISVYEERQRSPAAGARMTSAFRRRILGDEPGKGLIPVKELSSAFLQVKQAEDLLFAYYESSLVVEYLVEKRGLDCLRAILAALARGAGIQEAMQIAAGDLDGLEAEFESYARGQAEAYGEGVDWSVPSSEEVSPLDLAAVEAFSWLNSRNLWGHRRRAELHLENRHWDRAMASARELIDLFPGFVEEGNGYALLARAAQGAGDEAEETWAWEELAKQRGDAVTAYERLLELGMRSEDWQQVRVNAERHLAVNPFVKRAHWGRALAGEKTGHPEVAADSYGKLLRLGAENPAEVRFRLARLFRVKEPERARREVVEALLEAPRFREAHELLMELELELEEER